MPTRAPPRPAATLRLPAGRVAGLRVAGVLADRRGLGLLRRLPERQPRQHRHLLRECADLALQVRDPGPQHNVVRSQTLRLGTPALSFGTPELDAHTTKIAVTHDTGTRSPPRTRVQHPSPHGVSPNRPRAPAGLRDYRMLTVKDVLIGPEKITIRHRSPIRERTTTSEQHDSADTEGDQDVSCPVRWGRIHSSVSGGRSKVPVNCGPSTTPTSRATSGSETGSERINRDEATTTTASAPVATSRASMKLISTTGTHYPFPNAHHSRHYSIK